MLTIINSSVKGAAGASGGASEALARSPARASASLAGAVAGTAAGDRQTQQQSLSEREKHWLLQSSQLPSKLINQPPYPRDLDKSKRRLLAMVLCGRDLLTQSDTRNVDKLGNILALDHDEELKELGLDDFRDLFPQRRGYCILWQGEQVHLLRLSQGHIYRASDQGWREVDVHWFHNGLKSDQCLVSFPDKSSDLAARDFARATPTKESAGMPPRFYLEEQQGNMCGVHAINAFLGGPYLSEGDADAFLQNLLAAHSGELSPSDPEYYDCHQMPFKVRELGMDPAAMVKVIEDLSRKGVIAESYSNITLYEEKTLEEALTRLKSFRGDRLIVGLNSHFVAFRMAQDGAWYLLDSELVGDQMASTNHALDQREPSQYLNMSHGKNRMIFIGLT